MFMHNFSTTIKKEYSNLVLTPAPVNTIIWLLAFTQSATLDTFFSKASALSKYSLLDSSSSMLYCDLPLG